ncbi:hypothetical protein IWW40_001512 [Coemansia sp. RSA 1250]|nr:hypothetical protein IWW40_001512 [Coemansia sp. RSA 1250]
MDIWLLLLSLRILAAGYPLDINNTVAHSSFCDPGVQQHSGYIDISQDKHLFYWLFEARQPQQPKSLVPLVLWLNGGPGCSSMSGLFSGIGPCRIGSDGNSTTYNIHSWNTHAHMLFLDQPTNTGFSYGANITRTEEAAQDAVEFLHMFLTRFPQYGQRELHVMGESYAAHYVPAIASRIVADNQQGTRRQLPLTSIAVGNGLFNMQVQYQYLPDMACNSQYPPAVNTSTCNAMRQARLRFQQTLQHPDVQRNAEAAANATYAGYDILTPYQLAGGNPYDVRQPCGTGSLCDAYMDRIAKFVSHDWVRKALGTQDAPEFQLCSPRVQDAFIDSGDELTDSSLWLPRVLDAGVRVLNYVGDADLICNWMGSKRLLQQLQWRGQAGFNYAPDRPWIAGQVRSFGGLTFLRVNGAGHMVAKDQPETALAMLTQWLTLGIIM